MGGALGRRSVRGGVEGGGAVGAVGDEVTVRLAEVTALGQGTLGAAGGYVTGELATVVAPTNHDSCSSYKQ